jgi:hypothetical protein
MEFGENLLRNSSSVVSYGHAKRSVPTHDPHMDGLGDRVTVHIGQGFVVAASTNHYFGFAV